MISHYYDYWSIFILLLYTSLHVGGNNIFTPHLFDTFSYKLLYRLLIFHNIYFEAEEKTFNPFEGNNLFSLSFIHFYQLLLLIRNIYYQIL